MFVVLLSILVFGCMFPDFGGNRQYENLRYDEYAAQVGVDSMDPKGASAIYFRSHSTRDSYDCWWRMEIGTKNFTSLLEQMSTNMEDPHFTSYKARRVGPVRKAATDDVSFPKNWPKPQILPPVWWKQPISGEGFRVTRWELQIGDKLSDGRAKGWYWLYDSNSGTLWIWEWNHQWFDLGWDTNQQPEGKTVRESADPGKRHDGFEPS